MSYSVLVLDQQGNVLQCSGTGPEAWRCLGVLVLDQMQCVLVLDQKQGNVLQCSGTGPEAG